MGTLCQALPSLLLPSLAHGSPAPLPQRWLLGMKRAGWVAGVPSGFGRICFLRAAGLSPREDHTPRPPNLPLGCCEMRGGKSGMGRGGG